MLIAARNLSARLKYRSPALVIGRHHPHHQRVRRRLVVTGPCFGTRESRHINCVQQLKEADVLKGARFNESIALGAWGTEFHSAETMDSVFKLPGGNGVYEIPLGAVTGVDTANLFAPAARPMAIRWQAHRCASRAHRSPRVRPAGLRPRGMLTRLIPSLPKFRLLCENRARSSMATICPIRLPCNTRDFDFDLAKKNIGRVTNVNDRRLARAVLWSKNASSTAALE
jgi:hypothetical protein